jgi:hypothetical protein
LHVARKRRARMALHDHAGSAWHCMSRGCATQHAVRPTCRKVERGVTNVSGSARAVAPRTKIAVGRRRATAGGPPLPRAQVTPSPMRVPGPWSWATAQPLGKLEPLYPTSCPPFRRPPGADPGARGRPSVPARADPCAVSRDRPQSTDPPPFDRGRPASDPGAAAHAEAEPMERSAASQLATATRRSLQPQSCPLSERRRAGRPTHHSFIQVKNNKNNQNTTQPLHASYTFSLCLPPPIRVLPCHCNPLLVMVLNTT